MDPYIRRDVWNLILRLKKGRSIIMTTHVHTLAVGCRTPSRATEADVSEPWPRARALPSRWRRQTSLATRFW